MRGLAIIQRHHQRPAGVVDGLREEQIRHPADGGTAALLHARQRGGGEILVQRRHRLQGQLLVGVGDDEAILADDEGEAGWRGLDAGHGAHHVVELHVRAQHGLQGPLVADRLGEGHDQLAGGGVHVGGSEYRLAGIDRLLVPGPRGRIVAGRHRVQGQHALVGIADVGVVKGTCLLGRRDDGQDIALLQGLLHGPGDDALAAHPLGDVGGVAFGELAGLGGNALQRIAADGVDVGTTENDHGHRHDQYANDDQPGTK